MKKLEKAETVSRPPTQESLKDNIPEKKSEKEQKTVEE